ncbi:MAG: SDR family oxidoreductase [Clostridia bacterium]|nr:SDR family oxidoreductase [Clostridia bacterium]
MTKTAIVTGAAKGIGAEISKCLALKNYNVVINYHTSKKEAIALKQEITALGKTCDIVKADVSCFDQAKSLVDSTLAKYGNVDLLVNNAGISQQMLFNDMTEEQWVRMINVNLNSVFNMCRNVVDVMLRNHSGNIINISSVWGLVGASCEVHYSASKAAVIGLTKALAKELGPNGIRVNCIAPGVIKTDMLSEFTDDDIKALQYDTPLGKIGTVRDIANLALFLASDKASFITGQVISPNGGFVI